MRINYYEVLGCSENSTHEELKHAYHARLLQLHPDKNAMNTHTNEFHSVREAWQVLSHPQSRKEYDITCKQEELENESDLVYARISLSELEPTSNEDILSYRCKCGDIYYVQREHLQEKNVMLHVMCEGCTLTLVVET